MSDLQDPLDLWDINQRPTWAQPLAEAARRVANPDIEVAADMVERIGLPIGAYAGHRRVARNIAQRIFDAALGIKEDE